MQGAKNKFAIQSIWGCVGSYLRVHTRTGCFNHNKIQPSESNLMKFWCVEEFNQLQNKFITFHYYVVITLSCVNIPGMEPVVMILLLLAIYILHYLCKELPLVGKPEACEFLTYCQIMKNGAAAPEGNENEFKSTKTGVIWEIIRRLGSFSYRA